MGGFLAALLLYTFLFWVPDSCAQDSPLVRLNEVLAYPLEGSEWVELYNESNQDLDLSGWQLDDQEGGSKPIVLGERIKAKDYLVVELGIRLNNNGDDVRLIDPQGQIRDSFSYLSASKGKSFSFFPDQGWEETDQTTPGEPNWQPPSPSPSLSPAPPTTSPTPLPSATPTLPSPSLLPTSWPSPSVTPEPTSTFSPMPSPSPSPIPDKVILNEFLPYPLEGEEWVELYNQEAKTVVLDGWQIDDQENAGSSPLGLMGKFDSHSYLLFSLGKRLNNSGDQIRLIRSDGSLADQFEFGRPDPGVAWARDSEGQWRLTAVLTPGRKNLFDLLSSSPQPTSEPSSSPLPLSTPEFSLSLVSPSPAVMDSGSSANFISQLSMRTPKLTFLKRTDPQILGTAHSEILGIEGEKDEDVQKFWFGGGTLVILSSLSLIDRRDVIRFCHALFTSLADRFGLVFVDLPPFEHPEDLSRRQSNG